MGSERKEMGVGKSASWPHRQRRNRTKRSLFEGHGFGRFRVVLALCSLAAIFYGLHAMKNRRWVWSPPAAVQTPPSPGVVPDLDVESPQSR